MIEGTWDQVMDVATRCHLEIRAKSERVLTMMRFNDYGQRSGEIEGALNRVEKKLGRPVKK
ncbi:MAG: thiamine-binding protein [Bryobacteraceae bacterium]